MVYAVLNRKDSFWVHKETSLAFQLAYVISKCEICRHHGCKASLRRCFAEPPSIIIEIPSTWTFAPEILSFREFVAFSLGSFQKAGATPEPMEKKTVMLVFFPSYVVIFVAQCSRLSLIFKISYVRVCLHSTAATNGSTNPVLAVPLHRVPQASIFSFGLTAGFMDSHYKPHSSFQTWTSSQSVSVTVGIEMWELIEKSTQWHAEMPHHTNI